MIPTRSLDEADFQRQAHLGHALKAAIPVQAGAHSCKLLEHTALRVVIFQGLEIVDATPHTWALINDNARRRPCNQLLARVALLLAGVVIFALLLLFRLLFWLFDAIYDET